MLKWAPERKSLLNGFGIKVAIAPSERATCLANNPKKDPPVANGQRTGIGKIEFVWAAAAFLTERVHAPAKLAHVLPHRVQETDRLQRLVDVVGRTHALVTAVDDSLVRAVG